jgi:lipoprotein-anchoring transpeptidase ErfK/SrfK
VKYSRTALAPAFLGVVLFLEARITSGGSLPGADVVNEASLPPPRPGSCGMGVVRGQILLGRRHFSCGEIDGCFGSNLGKAVCAYQAAHHLRRSGALDAQTWAMLNQDAAPVLIGYDIEEQDVQGPFTKIPAGFAAQGSLSALTYQSSSEEIGERFHVSPALLQAMNPGKHLDRAGETIVVPNVIDEIPGPAAGIFVTQSDSSVSTIDDTGAVLSWYAATIGSAHDPLPFGEWKVKLINHNPVFYYNPERFWDANPADSKIAIPPGPNNPVGLVWIGLSKEHVGIHGTPDPGRIGHAQSHGCIRLTNWDALELSRMVLPGTPVYIRE